MSLTKDDLSDIRNIVLDAVEVVVEPLFEYSNNKTDKLEGRFDKFEGRFDKFEGRFDKFEGKFDKLEARMSAQERAQVETNRRLNSIETKLDDIDGRLEAVEADIKELYHMIDKVKLPPLAGKKFTRKSAEEKLLLVHSEVQVIAQQLGVQLPS